MTEELKHRAEHCVMLPAAPKRGPGQPKYVIADADLAKVLRAIRQGKSEVSIARALRINYRTWTRLKAENELIASVLSETRKFEEDELVGLLMDKARGGDTTSIIFALKGRHGYRDNGTASGPGDAKVNIQINLPAAQPSMDDYLRSFEAPR